MAPTEGRVAKPERLWGCRRGGTPMEISTTLCSNQAREEGGGVFTSFLFHDAGTKTIFASRVFHHTAPTIWNSLPADLTTLTCFCLVINADLKHNLAFTI